VMRLGFACAMAIAAAALFWAAGAFPGLTEEYYVPFSAAVSAKIGAVFAFTEYSVSELIAMLVVFSAAGGLIAAVFFLFKGIIKRTISRMFAVKAFGAAAWVILGCCALFLWFTAVWGLNYRAPGLDRRLGMKTGQYTLQDVYDTETWVAGRLNALAPRVRRGADGAADFGGFDRLSGMAADGFAALGKTYPTFAAEYPRPKKIINWYLLSKLGISGIYSPFLGECNVNTDAVDACLPFTISHEMSHRLAVAPEDEANFAAFLACLASPHDEYRYSGYFLAFIYCYNALSGNGEAGGRLSKLYAGLDKRVIADIDANNAQLKKYEGKARDVGEKINDTYLKSLGQAQGVKSYGLVVDLIVAYADEKGFISHEQ